MLSEDTARCARCSSPRLTAASGGSARTCRSRTPNPPLVSPFPPIADYGFLSDCETCALVAPSGAIEWMCLPRYDGPSVFGALLDRDAGTFRLGPADTMVPAARRYLPGHDDPRDPLGHRAAAG